MPRSSPHPVRRTMDLGRHDHVVSEHEARQSRRVERTERSCLSCVRRETPTLKHDGRTALGPDHPSRQKERAG
jgi:hypothetical protein